MEVGFDKQDLGKRNHFQSPRAQGKRLRLRMLESFFFQTLNVISDLLKGKDFKTYPKALVAILTLDLVRMSNSE